MYKSRLEKWGIKKNITARDMPQLVQQITKETSKDTSTALVIGGRQLPPGRVKHYLKRTRGVPLVLGGNTKAENMSCVKRPALAPRLMTLPDEMRLPDEVIQLSRQFVAGCCEGGIWCPDGIKPVFLPTRKVNLWLNAAMSAGCLIEDGHYSLAFKDLDMLFGELQELLLNPDPVLFVHMFFLMLYLPESIGQRLCAYSAEMSSILLPSSHPINLIWSRLSQASRRQLWDHGWTISRSYFEILRGQFGQNESEMLGFCRLFYVLASKLDFVDLGRLETRQAELVKVFERLGLTNQVLHTKGALAAALIEDKKYNSAVRIIEEMEEAMYQIDGDIGGGLPDSYYASNYYSNLWNVQRYGGMPQKAVNTARKHMWACIELHGFSTSRTVGTASEVQSWLAEVGQVDDANRLLHIITGSHEGLEESFREYMRDTLVEDEDDRVWPIMDFK
jgi:hypothetical protein